MIAYDLSWQIEDDLLIAESPFGTYRVRYDDGWKCVLLPCVDEIVTVIMIASERSLIATLLIVEQDHKRRAA